VNAKYYEDKTSDWLRSVLKALREGRYLGNFRTEKDILRELKRRIPEGCVDVWDNRRVKNGFR
jgi:hypothetical protein